MDYPNFLSTLPNIPITGVLTLFFLTLMRLAPIFALAPFLGSKLAPATARMGLLICLAFVFLPFLAPRVTTALNFDMAFLAYSLKELLIGFILAFFVTIPFYMVQTSGTIVDYLRGASIMQAQDPSMQSQTSPIGILYNYVLIVIFFHINGPFIFFDALLASYDIIPPAGLINPLFFTHNPSLWDLVWDLLSRIITIAIQLSAPALVGILMAEMFLGIANRLAPQVQIAFLGMSIKSLLGLALLWAAWFFILQQFTTQSYRWLDVIKQLIQSLRPFAVVG